ncbi:MAG: 6-pyruvoyl-tetrahydropterin synthase-related protein [Candidatus Aenigmatarchaeota archaeon]
MNTDTKLENGINIIVLISIFLFLSSYFTPDLILSKTITTGGDTASHYYPALYLKEYLLPNGKIIGWCPGNYAGFPIFQFYFPLPFLLIVFLSYVIPLQIAFKLITILGIFLLPVTALFSMKIMGFKFPLPAFAAIFTLVFLFHQGNSMWGGNIPSTLAGEFSFSISLALTVLFFGTLYKGIEEKKYLLTNSFLLFLIILTHVYTFLLICVVSVFFLLSKTKTKQSFYYLFKMYLLAFLLSAFWSLPLILKLPFTTAYNFVWVIESIKVVFPDIFLPFLAISILGFLFSIKAKEKRVWFLSFSILGAFILYLIASKIGVVDIRFFPFIQLMPMFLAAYGLWYLIKRFKGKWILVLAVLILTILWVNHNVTYIHDWIKWNYEGFENKHLWSTFSDVNEFLKGNASDPRVVYEHSDFHNSAGTIRAFESLPLFSGRSTLEGLYMQSTVSSPFVFYIQSEISKQISCPLPGYSCSPFNLARGIEHLKMFNVKHIIAISDKLKQALRESDEVTLVKTIEPYEIWEIRDAPSNYVKVLDYEPILVKTRNWKNLSYEWFKIYGDDGPYLVFENKISDRERRLFKVIEDKPNLNNLQKIGIRDNCSVSEEFGIEEIRIKTNCIGKPHLIKVSYYPNWAVEGADKIYLVSPSFMLIFPNQENVRIYYKAVWYDTLGNILSIIGFLILFYFCFRSLTLNQKITRLLKR